MRRGEVWWGAPSVPGQDRKRRPFLVVSDDVFNRNDAYDKVLAVHLTTVLRTGGPYSWEVALPRGAGGIPRASTVKCAEVYTLLKTQLEERVGAIPSEIMSRVDRALAIALGLRGSTQVGRSSE